MEAFAQALNYGIPLFVILIALELLFSKLKKQEVANLPDTISSLSSGIVNVVKDVLGLAVAIISYAWIEENFAFFDLQIAWWMFPLVFIVKDFAGYCIHRFEHMVNYFWNRHRVHHSSEEYNLACALRQSISEFISISIIFTFPLAFLGIPAEVFAIVAPIHLFAQFWYHTRLIKRMGFLEKIIVTPSHHRVHHAINPEYIDKNFSQIFIVWDKMFGTFQEEMDAVPPVYGITKPVQTWNPIIINFQHAVQIWKDFFRTNSWKDKARIWFMPTGWRPEDVVQEYPLLYNPNPYEQEKYMPEISMTLKVWSAFQLSFTLFTALFLFNNLANFSFTLSISIGAFIFFAVYAYTTIMDGKAYGLMLELIKSLLAVFGIYYLGKLFAFNELWSLFLNLLFVYHLVCAFMASVYLIRNKPLKLA